MKPVVYTLAVRGLNDDRPWVSVGTLTVVPAELPGDEPSTSREPLSKHAGQWALHLDRASALKEDKDFWGVMGATLTRLGLLPTWLPQQLVRVLRENEPLGLVTDTSAIALGSFAHALAVRGARPTHASVPDQVFMELHKQRETFKHNPKDGGIGARARHRARASASARLVRRLQRTHVLHVARPPDPLVRFFGANVGAAVDDEWDGDGEGAPNVTAAHVGANAQRDRLILEAVRAHRAQLGRVRLWLLTNDANLAGHASLEGFDVALCDHWRQWSKELATSPFFDPWSLGVRHVPVCELLEELAWIFGGIGWIELEASEGRQIGVPADPHAFVHLEEHREQIWKQEGVLHEREVRVQATSAAGLPETPSVPPGPPPLAPPGVPSPPPDPPPSDPPPSIKGTLENSSATDEVQPHRRAPSSATLVSMLVALSRSVPWTQTAKERRRHALYLRALRWIEGAEGAETLTPRGHQLVDAWLALPTDDVDAWATWLREAARDVSELVFQRDLQRVLKATRGSGTLENLVDATGWSREDVTNQVRLGHAFGALLLVRHAVWATPWSEPKATRDALDATAQVLDERVGAFGGIPVGELLQEVQSRRPMGLPAFRRALAELIGAGRLIPGGATEDSGDTVGALVPSDKAGQVAEYRSVDLKRGDWILPGRPCQVVSLVRGLR